MDFKDAIEKALAGLLGGDVSLEVPPDEKLGDYALACFPYAKKQKKDPAAVAADVASSLQLPFIERIETKGPYANIFIDQAALAKAALETDLDPLPGRDEHVMIEFSQANTHKAFHVGHVRGTSLGEALARILGHAGSTVIRANYQGDSGMHVAKWIWCYQTFHAEEGLRDDEAWIAGIYVDAVKRLAEDPDLQKDVDAINKKLDTRSDEELNALWSKTRQLSLDSLERIYSELNTRFDHFFFESQMEERAKQISADLVSRGIATVSDGATIVDLKNDGLGVWVLLRSDGTVLYSAKDLALAEKKFADLDLARSIYVVGKEQELHFTQLFATLEKMGMEGADRCTYVPVSLVKLPHGKMSSRTGDNVLYSGFKDELVSYAKEQVLARAPKLPDEEAERRALAIAISAMKHQMLRQHPNKEIVFRKDEALEFEGDTGPYLLYSYARASSILKKGKKASKTIPALHEKELRLARRLLAFKQAYADAASGLHPGVLVTYASSLAQAFNEFYTTCQVVGSEEEGFRLALVSAFKDTLGKTLELLGITPLEEM